ncbi:MAG: hypothetical protein ACI8P3_001789, partial [Saprospiraceae bacterium]
ARRNRAEIYGLLLRSAWKTVDLLCRDEENVGGKAGMTAVLHRTYEEMEVEALILKKNRLQGIPLI